jgi:transcription elongation factor GreA
MTKNIKKTNIITESGLKSLKEELEFRTTEKRLSIRDQLEDMRSKGDLSENDGYTMTLEDKSANEKRILEITEMIANSKVIKGNNDSKVDPGDTVTIKSKDTKQYRIVGEEEANPMENKISNSSPIGKALLGKRKGDKVEISTPQGKVIYEIIDIKS